MVPKKKTWLLAPFVIKVSKTPAHLGHHEREDHKKTFYLCPSKACENDSTEFGTVKEILAHFAKVKCNPEFRMDHFEVNKTFKCMFDNCDFVTQQEDPFKVHINESHLLNMDTSSCPFCQIKSDTMVNHILDKHHKIEYLCRWANCNRIYTNVNAWHDHMKGRHCGMKKTMSV